MVPLPAVALAVKVVLAPEQIAVVPVTLTVGAALTTSVTTLLTTRQLALDILPDSEANKRY